MPTLRRRSPVMKLSKPLVIGVFALFLCTAGNCSRARVESMNKMNEGVVAAQQKRFDDAIKLLDSAAAIDPQNEQAFWNMAIVHMEMRKYERARDDLQKAIAVDPESASAQEKLGTILIELKDWANAKTALSKAVQLEPALFKAYYKL